MEKEYIGSPFVQDTSSKRICTFLLFYWKMLFFILWPLCLLFIICGPWNEGSTYFLERNKTSGELEMIGYESRYMYRTLYVFLIMCGYWLTECIPIFVTGMIPMFAFPLLNVISSDETTSFYLKGSNMGFFTSIFLALAVEYSNLNKRLAYRIMFCIGMEPRRLHFGCITATFIISMWLFNVAAAAMMCPIVKTVIETYEHLGIGSFYKPQTEEQKKAGRYRHPTNITVAYYLGVCYAASIGGLCSILGTRTTLLYKQMMEIRFPKAPYDIVGYVDWYAFVLPVLFIVNCAIWFCLQYVYFGLFFPDSPEGKFVADAKVHKNATSDMVKSKLKELGPISWHESWVAAILLLSTFLTLLRQPKVIPGWADILNLYGPDEFSPDYKFINDPVILSFTTIFLLIFPSSPSFLWSCSKDPEMRPTKHSEGLVTWRVLNKKTPWGLIFLIGGTSCLTVASRKTKMSKLLGRHLLFLKDVPKSITLLMVTFCISVITQFATNMMSINVLLPLINELSVDLKSHPRFLGHPSCAVTSLSFMLPMSTPSNIISAVYANLRFHHFIKGGSLLLFVSYIILFLSSITYGTLIWQTNEFPDWAE